MIAGRVDRQEFLWKADPMQQAENDGSANLFECLGQMIEDKKQMAHVLTTLTL